MVADRKGKREHAQLLEGRRVMKPEIKAWLEKAKDAVEIATVKRWPGCKANHTTLGWSEGPKWIRVWTTGLHRADSRSCYCFLDAEGNIYKAAGWDKPAKGVRGTIETIDPLGLDGSTGWTYRRL